MKACHLKRQCPGNARNSGNKVGGISVALHRATWGIMIACLLFSCSVDKNVVATYGGGKVTQEELELRAVAAPDARGGGVGGAGSGGMEKRTRRTDSSREELHKS